MTLNRFRGLNGCSIEQLGRTGIPYREGGLTMFVGPGVLLPQAGIALCADTISNWRSSYGAKELLPDACRRILNMFSPCCTGICLASTVSSPRQTRCVLVGNFPWLR